MIDEPRMCPVRGRTVEYANSWTDEFRTSSPATHFAPSFRRSHAESDRTVMPTCRWRLGDRNGWLCRIRGHVACRCVRQCGDDSGRHGTNGRAEDHGWEGLCRLARDLLGSLADHRTRLRFGSELPPSSASFPRGEP